MLPVSITQRENISVNRISWRLYQYKLKSKVIKIEVCIRASLYMFLIHSMDYKDVNSKSSMLIWNWCNTSTHLLILNFGESSKISNYLIDSQIES